MRAMRGPGGVIHYRDEGDRGGLPVIFVNALGTDLRIWEPMATVLPGRLRRIRYDLRGHGLSEAAPGPFTIRELSGDLEALAEHLELERALVVGLSIGGLIAQDLAARRPDLAAGLALIATAARIGDHGMWSQRIALVEERGIAALADGLMTRWFSAAFRRHRPEELALWRAMVCRQSQSGYLGCCAALRDADLTRATARLEQPALVIGGDEDGATPPDAVEALADLIPGARFELVQGAGHLPCVEHPRICAAMLLDFIERAGLD